MIQWIAGAAFVAGLSLAGLLAFLPRFGPGTHHLLLLILPACLSALVHGLGPQIAGLSSGDAIQLSFALIIIAAAGGYAAGCRLNQQAKKRYVIPVLLLSVLLDVLLYFMAPPHDAEVIPPVTYAALGLTGYLSALFLLIISVVALANLEQILRRSTEVVRWELKFLFLGMGAFFAAAIYLSSQVLLYSPRAGLLSSEAMSLLHLMFLVSCVLIFISWRRGSGRARIAVSHGTIYSSITLLSVGVYLIASSLIARWASRHADIGLPMEALIFLLSAVILGVVILTTGFRHRVRAWVRRNIFAGRYDYRNFWLEAVERIRSIDPPTSIAAALADIIHRALGAIDVSIWVRRWNPNRLQRLAFLGTQDESLPDDAYGVVEEMVSLAEPVSQDDLADKQEVAALKDFMTKTRAYIAAPMVSSNRIVGVACVGLDRSGRPYDLETREFLRVLAAHAAGEFHKSDLLATLVEAKENEAFRNFSTFVLHDMKNFASTLSYIAQNAPRYRHNTEFLEDAFQSVYDTAEKMKRMCNSLQLFSSPPGNNKKRANLNQIARAVADGFNAGFSRHLRLELEDLPEVMVDAEELQGVIRNLLMNAREAISEDGFIVVRTAERAGRVELSVEDNGRGMSREFMEKELFLPFRTTKSGGLGIGLFQSKRIIEAHEGTISVESQEGKGTVVRVTLPACGEIGK